MGIAFFVDAARYAWLSPLPVLGLPLLLAAFPAGGVWLACRIGGRHSGSRHGGGGRGAGWRMLLAAAGWTIGEWLRSHVLTGFPWNQIGRAAWRERVGPYV